MAFGDFSPIPLCRFFEEYGGLSLLVTFLDFPGVALWLHLNSSSE